MSSGLRGDEDLFTLMDEMAQQQGYNEVLEEGGSGVWKKDEKDVSATTEGPLPPHPEHQHPKRIADESYTNEPVGNRPIWNDTVCVSLETNSHTTNTTATTSIVVVPTNPVVEVLRRRSYERFKKKWKECFERASLGGPSNPVAQLWKSISVPALVERWHFATKLEEQLIISKATSSRKGSRSGREQAHHFSSTEQIWRHIEQSMVTSNWLDPILVASSSSLPSGKKKRGQVRSIDVLCDEVRFECVRMLNKEARPDSYKTSEPAENKEEMFNSKKYRKKLSALRRSIEEIVDEQSESFINELKKRAMQELTSSTSTNNRASNNVPKISFPSSGDVEIAYFGLSFRVHGEHYRKLRVLFKRFNPEEGDEAFSASLFCLLARYDMLQGAGLQAALPGSVFDWLLKEFDCKMECFASPLNSRYERYCSAFYDTDAAFGSFGSFFEFDFSGGGSYQANPPFIDRFIEAMCERMNSYLEEPKLKKPLMFVVFVPSWTTSQGWKALESSQTLVRHVLLKQEQTHFYQEGTQHRRGGDRFRVASFDTSVFFLQNDAAAHQWSISDERARDLVHAFSQPLEQTEENKASSDSRIVSKQGSLNPQTKKRTKRRGAGARARKRRQRK